tara:strand:+ start:38132 stop:39940 length:1809 start_codon:yes stop_codon:yes gene_type:complete
MQNPITVALFKIASFSLPQLWQFAVVLLAWGASIGTAADRTTCVIPHAADRQAAASSHVEIGPLNSRSQDARSLDANPATARSTHRPGAVFADEAFGDQASDGWRSYSRVWDAHLADPANVAVRRFLGLPLKSDVEAVPRRGRSAPRWLGWRLGSYSQVDTPHFTIFSRADADASREVAIDLERCYWAWTQMFFPLWEGSAQVSTSLRDVSNDIEIADHLKSTNARISVRRKLQVVLFRDANEYKRTLGQSMPGIERSTGFYHDQKQTTFLYASPVPDRGTRRHEMVHQLFREATRSSLGRDMPAEESGFWLIEGIAGYFESMRLSDSTATVGGWDAPRLQFARHRVFVGGDEMSFAELAADGRLAAQKRPDIARWYAYAIAQTHHLMDRGDAVARQWVYSKLAELYKIDCDIAGVKIPGDIDRGLKRFLVIDDDSIQANAISYPLKQLCLAGCEVSPMGLSSIPASSSMQWLDLSRLPVSVDDVCRLVPDPSLLEQLSLEGTRIDNSIATWLSGASRLRELDLSFTKVNDVVVDAIERSETIETLWLTGTQVSDEALGAIGSLKGLRYVDLQRTNVSDEALKRLASQYPELQINPLQVHEP